MIINGNIEDLKNLSHEERVNAFIESGYERSAAEFLARTIETGARVPVE